MEHSYFSFYSISFTLEVTLNFRQALILCLWQKHQHKDSSCNEVQSMAGKQNWITKRLHQERVNLKSGE